MSLKDKRLLITGASRGIGAEIARKCAADGAIIGILGKTDTPHPKLSGTIHSVAKEVDELGGTGIPLKADIQVEGDITQAIRTFIDQADGLDILINNASALKLGNDLSTKEYNLIMNVNTRGTYLISQQSIPYLSQHKNSHILTLSPPLNLDSKWIHKSIPYTLSKYGMSLMTLGLAQSLKKHHIHVNSLWPKTTIATDAIKYNLPPEVYEASRTTQIIADAAYYILTNNNDTNTQQFYIDETVLKENGVTDFSAYAINPNVPPYEDIYIQ